VHCLYVRHEYPSIMRTLRDTDMYRLRNVVTIYSIRTYLGKTSTPTLCCRDKCIYIVNVPLLDVFQE
jgi:hypothetical protein